MQTLKNKWVYPVVIMLVVGMLFIIYRDANILYPLSYANGDNMGVFYFVKTIRDYGIGLVNPMVGGSSGGNMYDYIYSDSLSFMLVKIISLFTSDIYVITNLFYFLCYILVALSSLFVCRKLHYSNGTSIMVSVLYAFSPYIQMRYGHMWLVPYFMLPLSCYVALRIANGEVVSAAPFWKEKRFYKYAAVSFLCAFTGFYYAFFTCILYAIAFVIRIVNVNKEAIKKELYVILQIAVVALGCALQVIPNVLYWLKQGMNMNSEFTKRQSSDAELYGLKLVQMLLPIENHRDVLGFGGQLTKSYNAAYPLVNENITAALGLVASVGFIVSVIWLYQDKKQDKKLSYFNIGVFAVATIGGVGSLFSLLVHTPMRAYNRLSLVIMFMSLLCIAELFDIMRKKVSKWLFRSVISLVLAIGLFDQTYDYTSWDYSQLDSDRKFVKEIEAKLPEESMIFELPYVNWPSDGNYRMFVGYLESDSLHWSYGSMQGRDEAQWQEWVCGRNTLDMINILFNKGYHGIYLDAGVYKDRYGEDAYQTLYNELCYVLGKPDMISEKQNLLFWSMIDYKLPAGLDQAYLKWMEVCPYYSFGEGFYGVETDGTNSWVWCNAEGEMVVSNYSEDSINAVCKMSIFTGWPENSKLIVKINGEDICEIDVSSKGNVLDLPVELKPGKNVISFSCDSKKVEAPEDNRELFFQVQNVDIIIQ